MCWSTKHTMYTCMYTGTPNQPIVTFGAGPTFQWETDEEDQARPVDCYYGNVTVREPDDEVEVVPFDFCSGNEPGSEYDLPDFDDDNEYVVVVCSRNRLGDSCTEPLVHTPPPFTTVVMPTTASPDTPTTAMAGMTGLQGGAIAGIIVGVLLGCCLLWLLLLLLCLFCCCCGAREKRYFPQQRGGWACVCVYVCVCVGVCVCIVGLKPEG